MENSRSPRTGRVKLTVQIDGQGRDRHQFPLKFKIRILLSENPKFQNITARSRVPLSPRDIRSSYFRT
ncbi:hypothetical protein RchiOBHm_Chr5g0010521 [Rosa chinensis]|uniref:Uncharacterized protein n=1 Tax=Rosa chinensis TaxID=74649 RepID=A0A2P6Q4N5_ROSCH|nr:hypothetical protein RchiOBHm_Chr5g0010521 [Rosa chinensis]